MPLFVTLCHNFCYICHDVILLSYDVISITLYYDIISIMLCHFSLYCYDVIYIKIPIMLKYILNTIHYNVISITI